MVDSMRGDDMSQKLSRGAVMTKVSRDLGLLVLLTLLSLGTPSYATSFTVVLDSGTTQRTTALAASDVATGQDMTGMSVTAFFTGGALQTAIWNATGSPQAGGALGTNWQLDISFAFSNRFG
jgi:hypothetical protein